ncbi:MAG: hypothetical protein GX567_02495, partial [Clostridia bacterium]|nr:hypothetical protein [Clostridia bacterium]
MEHAKRVLAGFLVAVLCTTSFATDVFAAVSMDGITEPAPEVNPASEAEPAPEVKPTSDVEPVPEVNPTQEVNPVQELTALDTHIDFQNLPYIITYGDYVPVEAYVYEGANHIEDEETEVLDGDISVAYKGSGDTTIPADYEVMSLFDTISAGTYTVKADYSGYYDESVSYNKATAETTLTVNKATQQTPDAPEIESYTHNSVWVNTVDGLKYICVSDNVVPSVPFTGDNVIEGNGGVVEIRELMPETDYYLYTYQPSDNNYENSDISDASEFTTDPVPETPEEQKEVYLEWDVISSNYIYTGDPIEAEAVVKTVSDNKLVGGEEIVYFYQVGDDMLEDGLPTDVEPSGRQYKLIAQLGSSARYVQTEAATTEVVINQATPTISFDQVSYENEYEPEVTVTGVKGEDLNEDDEQLILTYRNTAGKEFPEFPKKKGDYKIVATYLGSQNYTSLSKETDFKLTKQFLTIQAKAEYTFAVGEKVDLKAIALNEAKKEMKGVPINYIFYKKSLVEPSPLLQGKTVSANDIGDYWVMVACSDTKDYFGAYTEAKVHVVPKTEKAPAAFTAFANEQTVSVNKADPKAEYKLIEKSLIPADGLTWETEGNTGEVIGAGAQTVSWTKLRPNTEYVVYARIPANNDEGAKTRPSMITKAKAVKTAQYVAVTFTSKNGKVIASMADRGDTVTNGSIIAPNSKLHMVAIPNAGYTFDHWEINKKAGSTKAEQNYIINAKSGTVAFIAVFKEKATLKITAGTKFPYTGSMCMEFPNSIVMKIGNRDVTKIAGQKANVLFYKGNGTKGEHIPYPPIGAGTYTAVLDVPEGDEYKAAKKTFTFTIQKVRLNAIAFDATNTENYLETETGLMLSGGMENGQYYALSTAKSAPKITSNAYQQCFDAATPLPFNVSAGKTYYVYTYAKATNPSLLDSAVVKSVGSIRTSDRDLIEVILPSTRVIALADTDKIVNISVKNRGIDTERIKSVEVNDRPVTLTSAMKKTIKSGGSITFPITLNYDEPKKVYIQVITEKGTSRLGHMMYEAVDAYQILWEKATIANATVGQKGGLAANVTLNATAQDGTKIQLKDCNIQYKLKGTEDAYTSDVPAAAGIYSVKISPIAAEYTGFTEVDYIIAAKMPEKLTRKDLEITQTCITVKADQKVPTAEYLLLEKGETPDWTSEEIKTKIKPGSGDVAFTGLTPGAKYVLYYRTAKAVNDNESPAVTVSKTQNLEVVASTMKKLTIKSNN